MYKTKKYGPFCITHCRNKKEGTHFVDVSLKGYEECPFGWNWGTDIYDLRAAIDIELFGLRIFYFRKDKKGFEIVVLGFWWIK